MTILSLALVRGIIGQIVGTAIGMGIVTGIRALLGLPVGGPDIEPALVLGALVGAVSFLAASGVMSDWFAWMRGVETPLRHGPPEGRPAWMRYFSIDYNHKVIGIQYTVTGMIVMGVGGVLAMLFRLQLSQPGLEFLAPTTFNAFVSAHGMIMIAAILLGVGGMMNYLVPLMIGASDMAFPRLNAFSFWITVPGAVMLLAGLVIGGWDTGWTGYPPNSALTPLLGVQLFLLGIFVFGFSSILGSANVIVTVVRMRAPGMTLFRMPIFVWAALATSIIQLTATQLIGLSFLMVSVQRVLGMGFFDPNLTAAAELVNSPPGNAVLFQHLFWFYSHPAVYVFVLPGLGIISELLPVFARKPLFGYKWIALSSMAIALVGFLVWGHHMFTSGMSYTTRIIMVYSTLLVAVPTGVKFFSWVGTMWRGKLTFPTPMLFTLGAISVFLIGGLTGPPNVLPTDLHVHDSYWVVGHFHATMFGGFVFPFFAAVYYWFPKATGRKYNETLGKLHFWLMTPAFWVQSLSQAQAGLLGMRRRIATYDAALGIDGLQMATTIAGFVILVSVLVMAYNLIWSARHAQAAVDNPWYSRSPEFQIPSPIPEHNYERAFKVVGEPYDYGLPGSTYVSFGAASAGGD